MMRSGRSAAYSLTMVAVVGGLVLVGAMALSLMVSGGPAFRVNVFGDPRTADRMIAVPAIRPAERLALPRGRIGEEQLLPMPATPAWMLPPRTAADSLYARAAALGLKQRLEAARAAAQASDRATALRRYAELSPRLPGDRTLLEEHAAVLAQFGEHRRAATLLRSWTAAHPSDYEVQMLAARNAWWAEQPLTADTLVGRALALRPTSAEALRLRETIRSTTQPPLAVARGWAAESRGAREQLPLARALVREGEFGEAVGVYRRVLADSRVATDSLLLEAASTAAAADSVRELERLTLGYLALHPLDAEARLRLARAYSWRGDYADALRVYRQLDWTDPSLRFEVAQVLVWSGQERAAEQELRVVAQQLPRDPAVFKLAGDLALWRADWRAASRAYTRALELDPTLPGTAEGLTAAARGLEQERLANLPRPAPAGAVATLESYADNQQFRWLTTRAGRSFRLPHGRLAASAQQSVFEGAPTGALSRNPAAGFRVEGLQEIAERAQLSYLLGLESYAAVRNFAVAGAGLSLADLFGAQLGVEYQHGPAAPRVATFAALQARATSDVLAVNVATIRGAWSTTTRLEGEHVGSAVGGANRVAAAFSASRTLTPALAATLGLSAQHVDRVSPVLPGWGSVLWAPRAYVEPTVGLTYRAAVRPGLAAVLGAQVGVGFARERSGDQRFGSGAVPIGALVGDVQYTSGPWIVGLGGSVGGAMRRGYRAATLRAQATYRLGP